MTDQLQDAVDVVVQLFEQVHDEDDDGHPEAMDCGQAEENHASGEEKLQVSIVRVPEYQVNARPLYRVQKKDLRLIYRLFNEQHRLLLPTYKSNAMYSCTVEDWESTIAQFMTETKAYSPMLHANEPMDSCCIDQYADKLVDRIDSKLTFLLAQQFISPGQHDAMKTNRSNVQFDRLSFIPDTRGQEIVVRPTIHSTGNPWFNLSQYLYELLRPVFGSMACKTAYSKGSDAILAVDHYHKQGLLRSTTLFVTVHVHRLFSMVKHEQLRQALEAVLEEKIGSEKIQGLSSLTIVHLVKCILEHQYLIYDDQLYRQVQGTNEESPLMVLLVNMFVLDWEQPFAVALQKKNEIYGRCMDTIFMTWNQSRGECEAFLRSMNARYPSIELQWTISNDVDYLDATICWNSKADALPYQLEATVHHQSKAEPHVLPYLNDDVSKQSYGKLVRAALIRAVLSCSDAQRFEQERQHIESSFTLNQFSPDYIRRHVTSFFSEFRTDELGLQQYRHLVYDELRRRVIDDDRQHHERHFVVVLT